MQTDQRRLVPGLATIGRTTTDEGTLELFGGSCRDGCGFLLTVVKGRLEDPHCQPFIIAADDILDRWGRIRIVHDWEAMTSYSTLVRREWTRWAGARLKGVPDVHFLVASKIISMGIATASLGVTLVGGPRLVSHWSRAAFEAEAFVGLDAELRETNR